ncbi:metalloregulator ArsR/SmtB family transcription factor [Nodosilinea sp. P-1105]|uniref:metalloregulator ArsR/SmtB family transcription factor n=1 Tax=Nodosilinea sp. P-1105 TaxID=2546229 RepID=UPI00146DAB4D|nr:transcriptional regulator [Nodosilinea sp. P-1105]
MSRPTANSDIFQAIADPTRRSILDCLRNGEQSVKDLAKPFDMSMPAISQHLNVLSTAGLVTQRRVGRQRFYQLSPEPLKQVSAWISHYDVFWQDKLDALGEYLEETSCTNPATTV